ncbi:MAG TPA: hypothetical protein VKU00_08870 [Chthonomonadaceae bacterium]|nr:hypothetical protein [Chthonomonadaceae bacterium]
MKKQDADARRHFLKTGIAAAGTTLWSGTFFQALAAADEQKSPADAATIGRRELLEGLDGMSRVADAHNTFAGGHTAAAVMASAFFCREQKLDNRTQKEILTLIETRLLKSSIYAPRPEEKVDPELIGALVKDLDAGIDTLRQSGHNIIFTNICLKALREVPEAATPERMEGLRKMVQSFGNRKGAGSPLDHKETFVDLRDETKFIHFVFEEYLKAMDLYRNGKGYHGFAGHLLTAGHALVELRRMGYRETADKGVEAYWQFVQQARDGADLGGEKVGSAPVHAPTPLIRDYWLVQEERQTSVIVSSHLVKYPYSFFALAKELHDDALKQRVLDTIYYLTAVS